MTFQWTLATAPSPLPPLSLSISPLFSSTQLYTPRINISLYFTFSFVYHPVLAVQLEWRLYVHWLNCEIHFEPDSDLQTAPFRY